MLHWKQPRIRSKFVSLWEVLNFCSDLSPADIFYIWTHIPGFLYTQRNDKELPQCVSPHQMWTSALEWNELCPNIPLI